MSPSAIKDAVEVEIRQAIADLRDRYPGMIPEGAEDEAVASLSVQPIDLRAIDDAEAWAAARAASAAAASRPDPHEAARVAGTDIPRLK